MNLKKVLLKRSLILKTTYGFLIVILKKEGTAVGLANGILSADGKIIYTAENLKVGLFKS